MVVCGHGHGETGLGGAEQDAGVAEVGGDEGCGGGRVPEGGGAPGVGVSWGEEEGGEGGGGGGEEWNEEKESRRKKRKKRRAKKRKRNRRKRREVQKEREKSKRRSYAVDISARLAVDPPLNGFAPAFGSAAISPVVFSPRRNHGHVLVIKSMSAFRKAYISTPSTARQSPKSG